MTVLKFVITFVVGYLLGNANGAVLMSTLVNKQDVRKKGSGNAGFTNYLRNFGKKSALVVMLIDFLKTVLGCALGFFLLKGEGFAMEGIALGGLGVSLGHDFPALLGFKGGKGIICGATIGLMLDWRCFLIAIGTFAVVALVTQYVSLGSVLAALAMGISVMVFHNQQPWVFGLMWLAAGLAIFMHRGNIVRLCKGTETKTHFLKKKG